MTLTALITEREGELLERIENAREFNWTGGFEPRFLAGFHRESITAAYRLGLERAKGCVPEKDNTTDASEYERADRIAWNQCRDLTLANIEEALAEQAINL